MFLLSKKSGMRKLWENNEKMGTVLFTAAIYIVDVSIFNGTVYWNHSEFWSGSSFRIDETYSTLLYRNFDSQGFGGIHSVFTKNCDGIFDFCNYFGKYHLSFFGV